MKVLHVMFGNGFSGGSSFSMTTLAAGLQEIEDIEIQAVVPWEPKHVLARYLQSKGVRVYELVVPRMVVDSINGDKERSIRFFPKKAAKYLFRNMSDAVVRRIIQTERIDLVHIGDAVIDVGAAPAFCCGIPVVWHLREYGDLDWGLSYLNEMKALDNFGKACACIAVSRSVANYYKLKDDLIQTHVVYNGIVNSSEVDSFYPRDRAVNCFKIAFFSGVRRNKGVFDLLEAISLIRREDCEFANAIQLDIYGGTNEDDYKQFCQFIEDAQLSRMVFYKGWDKIDLNKYRDYDLSVVASKCEAFGRVTAESQLAGVLVVGADTGGTRELLEENRGILYKEGSAIDLAAKLKWAWEHGDECQKLSERAFEFAKRQYCIEDYVSSVERIYREILAKAKSRGDE